ncbi:MAG: UDP-N-acetylmuramoyl-L-alanine--D-glutamate ligase [Betaproteobacteria bacterium]|nr:UDP-N-acetylmuramoyl-L-alanine--D-glutamate ligase [Betaproteobacteria bacterium]
MTAAIATTAAIDAMVGAPVTASAESFAGLTSSLTTGVSSACGGTATARTPRRRTPRAKAAGSPARETVALAQFAPLPEGFSWTGSTVGVVGLGDSGLAMARWLVAQGAEVRICDSRENPPRLADWIREHGEVRFSGGTLDLSQSAWLENVDCLAWSPGLSPHRGPAAGLAALARERAIPVVGEIDLFCRAIAQEPEPPRLIAVTGTNGKTTTSCLLAHLLQAAGVEVALAGNVGPPALEALLECRQRGNSPAVWVLELSSFQLEFAPSLAPHAATILNLSEDHLDWHPSLAAYGAAKQQIFARAGVCVWNRDDLVTQPAPSPGVRRPSRRAAVEDLGTPAPELEPIALGVLADRLAETPAEADDETGELRMPAPLPRLSGPAPGDRVPMSFGLDAPSRLGDFGIVWDGGLPWLAEGVAADVSLRRRALAPGKVAVRANLLMPADALRIRGRHNQANALAALALARAAGVPMARLLHGLREYVGEPHRCESVAIIDDVEYVDDSKGTNVGATVAALNGLAQSTGYPATPRLLLIAGGDGKGQSFEPLAEPVERHAKAVFLIGQDAWRLRAALANTGVDLIDCATLEQAVEAAAERARTGDLVLLSPACASFGMFRNYLHRSEVFTAAVQQLAHRRGQPC